MASFTFAFAQGAKFEDKYGLLQGKGTFSKHMKIKTLQDLDADALTYYITQAVALDSL